MIAFDITTSILFELNDICLNKLIKVSTNVQQYCEALEIYHEYDVCKIEAYRKNIAKIILDT